jgi:Na+(H+)/acetate symporter ActP
MGPILLIALGGIFVGGAWSLYKQRKPVVLIAAVGLAAALAIAAGILWQV